ncbi:peptide-methionine (S)-S-oxide reductase MsrA [Candidatus Roizmanbacteria bacterium]|nr:peptide-methionine (S)-S-oxide reductase MsrA [Candidatus Roizmanbacteria bacterium]
MNRQKAYFGLGCFWGPDEYFSKLPGVTKTTAGYAGGEKKNPTYTDLGDHTETVEIEYNPEKISYDELLHHFWNQHNPTYEAKRQYRSVIFYSDDEQKKQAENSMKKVHEKLDHPIVTSVEPMREFYKAEEYHQKYLAKNRGAVC